MSPLKEIIMEGTAAEKAHDAFWSLRAGEIESADWRAEWELLFSCGDCTLGLLRDPSTGQLEWVLVEPLESEEDAGVEGGVRYLKLRIVSQPAIVDLISQAAAAIASASNKP